MHLTQKLLGFLNRVFDKDPGRFVGLRVAYDGALTWSVAEGFLTLTAVGGSGVSLSYDLSQFTLASLVNDLAGRRGYTVTALDPDRAGLSALVLLDGVGDLSLPNGDALLGYTSLLWAFTEAWAHQLQILHDQADQAVLQMSTTTASGAWLDELGSYYGVTRQVGEADAQYGPRIIAESIRPLANNVALEVAIQTYTGQPVTVQDVTIYRGVFPVYDGTITHNAAYNYATVGTPNYGLFDVTVAYDLLLGGDIHSFLDTVTAIVEKLRASGTHLRSLALSSAGTPMADTLTAPTDATSNLAIAAPLTDTLTAPTDATVMAGNLADLTDTLTAPTDAQAGSVLQGLYASDGTTPITDSTGAQIQINLGALFV